jgi:hypothetical protein
MSSTFLATFYAFLAAGILLKLIDEAVVEFRSRQRDKRLSRLLGHLEDLDDLTDYEIVKE